MKYEQEKNKINKLWEESQNNTNELNKKKNDSLIQSPNNFSKKSKSLLDSSWAIFTPQCLAKGNQDYVIYPIAGHTYCIYFLQKIKFDRESQIHLQIYRNGSLIFDKKIIPESYPPPPNFPEYWYYEFTIEEFNQIQYSSNYTWRMRFWDGARFHNWSDLKTFYTYEFYPIPPSQEFSYQLPSGNFVDEYEVNDWMTNKVVLNTDMIPPSPYPTYLALPYENLYYAAHDEDKCKWSLEIDYHPDDIRRKLYFTINAGFIHIYRYVEGEYEEQTIPGFASIDIESSPSGINVSVFASLPAVPEGWALCYMSEGEKAYAKYGITEEFSVYAWVGESKSDSWFFPPTTEYYWVIFPEP